MGTPPQCNWNGVELSRCVVSIAICDRNGVRFGIMKVKNTGHKTVTCKGSGQVFMIVVVQPWPCQYASDSGRMAGRWRAMYRLAERGRNSVEQRVRSYPGNCKIKVQATLSARPKAVHREFRARQLQDFKMGESSRVLDRIIRLTSGCSPLRRCRRCHQPRKKCVPNDPWEGNL